MLPIAVGGENLIDHVTSEGTETALPGGSPFNVALALGRQGANVRYVSPISTDRWGDRLAEMLSASGVALTGGRIDRPTTMARVTIADGIPTYRFERDGTAERAVSVASLAESVGDDTMVLHSGSLALTDGHDAEVWAQALTNAHQEGRFVSIDPNVRLSVISDFPAYRERLFRIFQKIHLLKLSDEDLDGLFPDTDENAAIEALLGMTAARLVVLTRGREGASAWLRGDRLDIPAPPVSELIDTVGAGDTFMATLLASLANAGQAATDHIETIEEREVQALLHRAATAAALNCARAGCSPPAGDEIDAVLTKQGQ